MAVGVGTTWRMGFGPVRYTAAALAAGTALIHLAVAPAHFQLSVWHGGFFVVVGIAQLALAAALLLAPVTAVLAGGAIGSLAVIAVWAASRTVGVPVPPNPWTPEAAGLPDVAATAMEAVTAVLLLSQLVRRPAPRPRTRLGTVLAAGPALLAVLVVTALAVGASASEMPVGYDASPVVPGRPSTTVDLLTAPPGSQPVRSFTLTAEVARIDGRDAWTYDGTVPGPELRVQLGDRVRVTLVNHLPVSTTIHWHGVPGVTDEADGVAGITQQAVAPGRSFVYEFVPSAAGTFWYHSHQDTANQIPRGLFGALVVEPAAGRVVEDRDYAVVLHEPQDGGPIEANGSGALRLAARPGETVRLRLIDAVEPGLDGSPRMPVLLGTRSRVVALDGRDLAGPQLIDPQRVPLGMGQRADLVFTMPSSGAVRLVDGPATAAHTLLQQVLRVAPHPGESVVVGDGPLPSEGDLARMPVFDLTRYGTAEPDPLTAGPFDVTAPVVLTAQPGLHDGRPEVVQRINGRAAPDVAPITVREGQLVELRLVNQSNEYHPMHLHGHTMAVISRDGAPIQGSPVHLDTVLVAPHQTWDVAFRADNPGIWMLHCHVLAHADFGMSMTVNYVGTATPYEMGPRSGNVPE